MTQSEHDAVKALQTEIDRERARADFPGVRALLVILSNGLPNLAEANPQARKAA